MKEYAAPKFTAYLDAIARVVADGQASGELRSDVSPHLAARAIFGALDGITMTWALGKADRGGLVRASGQLAEMVLRGLSPQAGRCDEAAARARRGARDRARASSTARGFLEVETPVLVPSPGLDLHLDAFEVAGGDRGVAALAHHLARVPDEAAARGRAGSASTRSPRASGAARSARGTTRSSRCSSGTARTPAWTT